MAEITLSHLLRLANEHHCFVSRKQALKFLNQQGHAFEMWKQMMLDGAMVYGRANLGVMHARGLAYLAMLEKNPAFQLM